MTAANPDGLLPRLRELARTNLRGQADRSEAASAFPRSLLTELGRLGVLVAAAESGVRRDSIERTGESGPGFGREAGELADCQLGERKVVGHVAGSSPRRRASRSAANTGTSSPAKSRSPSSTACSWPVVRDSTAIRRHRSRVSSTGCRLQVRRPSFSAAA
jgi:hypothetical protein